jgi:hypothetical protein
MKAPSRLVRFVLLLAAVAAVPAAPAVAQEPPPPPPAPEPAPAPAPAPPPEAEPEPELLNPCRDPLLRLRCPDLVMAPPTHLTVRRVGGVVRLLSENRIVNIGQGPLEVRARHTATGRFAKAYQVVRTRTGGARFFPEAGYVYFKAIPGQGHYWKYYRAARFELWTLNPDGTRAAMRRTGPKLSYCFRDLERVRSFARAPRSRQYPACSQDAGRSRMQLGTSAGWADIYPASYHENWISVTGLRGCFAFVHRADPLGELVEEREDNNVGSRRIRLPPSPSGRIGGC